MKIKDLLCAGVAALTGLGCAAQTPPAGGPGLAENVCGEQPCQVVIKVTGHPISSPPVRIEVSAATLAVTKGTRRQIVWILDPSSDQGFQLRANSIVPHTGAANPGMSKGTTTQQAWDAEFTRDSASSTNTRFVMNNRNSSLGTPRLYYYDVKVFHIRTGDQAFTLDPAIMNDF